MITIDEVHNIFRGKYFMNLNPGVIIGFTALLHSYKRYRLNQKVRNVVSESHLPVYDFKRLEKIDSGYKPPRAITDMFNADGWLREQGG